MDKRFGPICLAVISIFLLLHIIDVGAVVFVKPWSFAQKNDSLNLSETNSTRPSNTTGSLAYFEAARHHYLQAWNHTNFSSLFNSFVKQNSVGGFGIFEPHSNIFSPGESIVLYLEPIGFHQKPIVDKNKNTLYQINLTTDINISNSQGKQLSAIKNLRLVLANSHQNNTELYLAPKLTQGKPFPPGNYTFTYIFRDGTSGKSFQIVKAVRIAQVVSPVISPVNQPNLLRILVPLLNK